MNVPLPAVGHSAMVRAGLKRLAEGKIDEADALLREALAARPNDPWVLNGLGGIALRRRDLPMAEKLIGAAATLLPGEPELLANLAALHAECGRLEEARLCLDEAVRLAPDHAGIRERRAELLLALQRPEGAAQDALLALQRDSSRVRAWVLRGLAALAAADRQTALACFRQAATLDETCLEAWHNLSELHAALGDETAACDCAERAYLGAPSDPLHIVTLARSLSEREPERARALLRRALALAPVYLPALELQALIGEADGSDRRALAALAAAARAPGAEAGPALLALARALAGAGRFGDALLAAERAVALDLREARRLRLACLFALGRFEEAYGEPSDETQRPIDSVLVPEDMPLTEVVFALRLLPELAERAGRALPLLAPSVLHALLAPLAIANPEGEAKPSQPLLLAEAMARLRADASALAMPAPYISVEPARLDAWRSGLAALPGPRIGIVWPRDGAGLGLEDLLAAVEPIGTAVSLAMGDMRDDLERAPHVIDAGHRIAGPEDLAAAIAALDLVIAPDCLAIHLSGALGRPGIVLLPRLPHWVWRQQEAGRAAFYPSLSLFPAADQNDPTALASDLTAAIRSRLSPQ